MKARRTGPAHYSRPGMRTKLLLCLLISFACCALPNRSFAIENNLPPYEQSLRRLSAVVGALMYLDPLCNGSKAQDWHDQMSAILEAENADDTRRRQLTDRFNKSYRTYARTYRDCNSQAAKITQIYHAEGQSLLTTLRLRHAR